MSAPERQRPLRVLVDATAARTGGGRSVILSQLPPLALEPDLELTVVAAGDVAAELEAVDGLRVRRPPRGGLARRLLWQHLVLAARARRFDVLYCPLNFALPLAPARQVVSMHNALLFGDAGRRFRRHRRLCSPWRRRRLAVEAALGRLSARRAATVVVSSPSMRDAVMQDTGRRDVQVAPLATPALPGPTRAPGPCVYVLSVANDEEHKDWDALVDLFARRADLPPLVVVGGFADERRRRLEQRSTADRIRFRGAVTDRGELASLYAGAACCVVHSWVESVGLTALEALARGVPVVASDIPGHRESAGSEARFYDPADMEALAAQVQDAIAGPRPTTVPSRTWDDQAHELAAILREAAGLREPGSGLEVPSGSA